MQHGVVDTRVHFDAARQLDLLAEHAESVVSGEVGVAHITGIKVLGYFDLFPIGSLAPLRL